MTIASIASDPNVLGALPAGYAVIRALEWASSKAALLARVGRIVERVGQIMQGATAAAQAVEAVSLQSDAAPAASSVHAPEEQA